MYRLYRGKAPEPLQKHDSWVKHTLWGLQNHSRPQPHPGSLAACPGGNIKANHHAAITAIDQEDKCLSSIHHQIEA